MKLYENHIESNKAKASDFLKKHNVDALILTSGIAHYYFDDDIEKPHKIPASFNYWIPEYIGTHQYLVITQETLTLFSYRPTDFWLKVPDSFGTWADEFKIEVRADLSEIISALTNINEQNKCLWIGPDLPSDIQCNIATTEQLMEIDSWRLIKTPFEITAMKQAQLRAAIGHIAVHEALGDYISEFQMHLDYLDAIGMREFELPYNNIIAYNDHASILHYQELERTPPAMLYSFLIDAGASIDGYIADISRTHAGEDSNELFKELLKGMRAIKLELIDHCKAGVSYMDIHQHACRIIGELLIKHNFIQDCSIDEALEKGLVRIFFPHGIGHLLGLNTHDTPSIAKSLKETNEIFKSLRLTQVLQDNMVLTIEPGIYFNNTLISEAILNEELAKYLNLDLINSFIPYGGIRDEDNIVISGDKPRNLTAEAFTEIGFKDF